MDPYVLRVANFTELSYPPFRKAEDNEVEICYTPPEVIVVNCIASETSEFSPFVRLILHFRSSYEGSNLDARTTYLIRMKRALLPRVIIHKRDACSWTLS